VADAYKYEGEWGEWKAVRQWHILLEKDEIKERGSGLNTNAWSGSMSD